jgi:ubiquinol-cytochrome c reductase cytochrome b subunit
MNLLKKFWIWLDDRTGITEAINPLAKHLVPPGAKWAYVFGSATLFCFILQVVTGVALALLYQPTTEDAYE